MKRSIAVLACCACWNAVSLGAASSTRPTSRPVELVPLETKLPKPGFDGEWMRIGIWKRERPDAEDCASKLAPLLVPKGTVNLALNKPVTSSEREPIIGKLEQVTDGYKEGGEGAYVELAPGRQWVQIDLGRSCRLYAVLVWHNAAWPGLHRDVIVQLSDDPKFERNLQTIFNNDDDDSSKLGRSTDREFFEAIGTKVMDAKGISARYVRLYSNGNIRDDQNTYVEVEVHGLPPESERSRP